ncbi:MAG: YhfC family intramembrane metalloprotease [Firmicutes bacterium]|nr:YhfC family intramembrane metalloprotease [Bacillota bacterium]
MIPISSFVGIGIMIAGGILLPVIVCILWLKRTKEKFTTVLVGAATWFVFAIVLETIPKYFLFNPATSIGRKVLGSVVLYTIVGALLAGVFEEVGRYIAFKTVLKKRTNKETGISHGIGHGGFEAMFLMGYAGIQYIIFSVMINTGAFQELISQTAATGIDVSSLEALPGQIMSITPLTSIVSILERVFAMLLHVGLSIMVFFAVRDSKVGLLLLAILLHAFFDVPAAMYQAGVLNLYVTEFVLACYALIFFVIVYRMYKKAPREKEIIDTAQ